jgi:hypothetical protein
MGTRATEKRIEADAQRMTQESQVKMAQAQAFAMAQQAAAQQAPQPPTVQVPPHLAGLAGPGIPVMITREMHARLISIGYSPEQIAQMTPQQARELITTTAIPMPPAKKPKKKPGPKADENGAFPIVVKRLGKTDEEWFGQLMPNVIELREHVAYFIESCETGRFNKEGTQPEGVLPEQAAMAVLQAVGIVTQKRYPIPSMIELFFQQRYADFVDVLLPDAPQTYRDDLVVAIVEGVKRLQQMAGEDPSKTGDKSQRPTNGAADDDDDDDSDDADDDDDPEVDPEAELH